MRRLYMRKCLVLLLITVFWGCSEPEPAPTPDEEIVIEEPPPVEEQKPYFPPIQSGTWETVSPDDLGWNAAGLDELHTFLAQEKTKAFMVLHKGKIAVEKYYNNHSAYQTWQWNSAGKPLVTAVTGIAQQEGVLDINKPVSDYIGTGWTSAPVEKETLIQPYHLLSMSSGLSDETQYIVPANLNYVADAGTRWSYHNVFQVLIDVVTQASQQDFRDYFNANLQGKIGMTGSWNYGSTFKIYHSNARSMARFGLLALHKGSWNEEEILNADFFNASISSSQSMNPAYGYMWWLNGKSTYMLPGLEYVYSGSLIPNAPANMYAAMGYNEQRIYVVPDKELVIIRMGEVTNLGEAYFEERGFDYQFWERLNAVIE